MRCVALFLWLGLIVIVLWVNWCGFCVWFVESAEFARYEESVLFWIICLIVPACLIYKFMLVSFGAKNGGMERYITMGSLNIFAEIWYYNLVVACWVINLQKKLAQRYLAMWVYFILNISLLNWFSANMKGFGLFLTNFSIIILMISLVYLWNNFENIFSIKGFWILASSSIVCIIDSISWRGMAYFAVFPMIAEPMQVKQALMNEIFFIICLCLKSLPLHEKFDMLTGIPLKPEYMFGPRFLTNSTHVYHIMGTKFDQILMAADKLEGNGIFISKQAAKQHFLMHFGSALDKLFLTQLTTKSTELLKYNLSGIWFNEAIFSKLYEAKHNLKLTAIKPKVGCWGDFSFESRPKMQDLGLTELLDDEKSLIEVKTPSGIYTKASLEAYCNKYERNVISLEPIRLGLCIDVSASPYCMFKEMQKYGSVFEVDKREVFVECFHQESFTDLAGVNYKLSGYEACRRLTDEILSTKTSTKLLLDNILEPVLRSEQSAVKLNAEQLIYSITEK